MKICVFDDDQQVLKLVKLLLEKAGHQVQVSDKAGQAVGITVANLPDAVLTDRMMPGMDGLQLIGKLRARRELTRTTIILMSVDSRDDNRWRREAREAGADDFIAKPFDPATFASEIEAIVARRRGDSTDDG